MIFFLCPFLKKILLFSTVHIRPRTHVRFQNHIQYLCPLMETKSVEKLIAQYGKDRDTETLDGEKKRKKSEDNYSTKILTEWRTFPQLSVQQPWATTASQAKGLEANWLIYFSPATMGYYCITGKGTRGQLAYLLQFL